MEENFDSVYFYNEFSKTYDKLAHPELSSPTSEYARIFGSIVASLKPESILEIGCGTGKRLFTLVKYFESTKTPMPRIVGIDPSEKMTSKLPKEVTDKVEIRNLMDTSSFKDGEFDLVYTSGVLCSILNKDAVHVAKEAFRISKKYSMHTDTPKDKPHLNDLDFFRFFLEAGCRVSYWSTICPYPIPGEQEHQIVLAKTPGTHFPTEFPYRTKSQDYDESWREVLAKRIEQK